MKGFVVNSFVGGVASLALAAAASGGFVGAVASSSSTAIADMSVTSAVVAAARFDALDTPNLRVAVTDDLAGDASPWIGDGITLGTTAESTAGLTEAVTAATGVLGADSSDLGIMPTPGAIALLVLAGFVMLRRSC